MSRLCEAACTCGLNGNPVTVRENENAIIETAYASNWMQPHPPKHRIDKKIAIIGSLLSRTCSSRSIK